MSEIIKYLEKWHNIEGQKPCNEKEFIDLFLKLIKNADEREVGFDGDGAYFGKQITFKPGSMYGKSDRMLNFEIAYDEEYISVYDGNNEGFWVPEYIKMDIESEGWGIFKKELFEFLRNVFGI